VFSGRIIADRATRQAAEPQAADAFQQHQADQQEAADRAMLRRRWTCDQASFDAAYDKLLEQLRIDRALGRQIDTGVPAPRIEF
jgi:hypothetical protein